MIKRLITIAIFLFFSLSFFNCSQNGIKKKEIFIVIEKRLSIPLQNEIRIYKNDLKNEGYNVKAAGVDSITAPLEIRNLLKQEYEKNKNFDGAVFIGNIKSPLFNIENKQGDPYWNDYLCDFYYMDLDGVWEDRDNNGTLDHHENSGNKLINWFIKKLKLVDRLTPEIWVSRISANTLTSLGNEITLMKDYFQKNHEYRTGKMILPPKRAFLISDGVNLLKSDWGARPKDYYSNTDIVQCNGDESDSLKKFLGSKAGYEWGIINVFSGPTVHHFDYIKSGFNTNWWNSKQGRENIRKYSDSIHAPLDISSLDIKNMSPNVLFYQLLCSETGRFNCQGYLAGAYIFSGSGLLAIAGTQHSGAVGVPFLFKKLNSVQMFGDIWKDALTWIIKHSDEKMVMYWCDHKDVYTQGVSEYKGVLIGDGTLKLPAR